MNEILSSKLIIDYYKNGIFPMSEHRDDANVFFISPKKRSILPLDRMHVSRSLFRSIKQKKYQITTNSQFEKVILSCASPKYGRQKTWINSQIISIFLNLHTLKKAHSIEIWENSTLIGGIYGLAIGSTFFAESMFSRKSNASKIALVWLVSSLRNSKFTLFDTQFITPHLASLGCIEIENKVFLNLLSKSIDNPLQFPDINSDEFSNWEVVIEFLHEMRDIS